MAEMSNAAMKQLPSLRPLIILLVGLPLVDFILNTLWQEGMIQSDSFLIGLMVGEIGFAIVLAGAMGRAWVLSLLLTSWLAVAVTLMSVVWENRHYREGLVDSALFTIATIPPIVFCGSLPFLLVRSISGYRLSHPQESPLRERTKMEDFFITTAVFAAMLVTIPAAFKVSDSYPDDFVPLMVTCGLSICIASLVIVLPATVTYFVLSSKMMRLALLVALTVCWPFSIIALLNAAGMIILSGSTLLEEFGPLLVTAAGCLSICLIVVRSTGFRWCKDVKQQELPADAAAIDPLADDQPPGNSSRDRWLNRYAAIALVVASVAQVLTCNLVAKNREEVAIRLKDISKAWRSQGGTVDGYMHSVRGFLAPPGARIEDIEYLIQFPELTSLELARTEATDATLAKAAARSSLECLNFSDTQIGDAGLLLFKNARNLGSIKLARSQVTANGLRKFLADKNGHTLDLRGLGLTDADLAPLPLDKFNVLTLDDNPLTNACLPHLAHATHVHLNRTRVDGSGLTALKNIVYLEIDHIALDDEQLLEFMKQRPNLEGLSIRGTQVTDACLPALEKVVYLQLGETAITPTGLLESKINPPSQFSLNDRKFDGSLFVPNRWSIGHLDLRSSGITDQDIGALANVADLQMLSLCDCDITDASLPALAQLNLTLIDISGTKISCAGARKHLGSASVYISKSQCSDEEFEEAKNNDKWHFRSYLAEP